MAADRAADAPGPALGRRRPRPEPEAHAARTVERLRRTVRRLADEGIIEAGLLDRARPQQGDDRLIRLVAGIKAAAPDRRLQRIAAQLEAMRERTPRGGTRWHASSVKHLLTRAEHFGLAGSASAKLGEGIRP